MDQNTKEKVFNLEPLFNKDGSPNYINITLFCIGISGIKDKLTKKAIDQQIDIELREKYQKNNLPNADVILKYYKKRYREIQLSHVFGGVSGVVADIGVFLFLMLSLLCGTYFALSFPVLGFLPNANPLFVIVFTITTIGVFYVSGIYLIHKILVPQAELKGDRQLSYDLRYTAKFSMYVFRNMMAAFLLVMIIASPGLRKIGTMLQYKEIYHVDGEGMFSNRKESHEIDEELFGTANPIAADLFGYAAAKSITNPMGKVVSYVLLFISIGIIIVTMKNSVEYIRFNSTDLFQSVFEFFASMLFFFALLLTGDLYIPSMLGMKAQTVHIVLIGVFGFICLGVYVITHPPPKYSPVRESHLKPATKKSKMKAISEIDDENAKKIHEQLARKKAEDKLKEGQPPTMGMNKAMQKLNEDRRKNDAKPSPWDGKN